MEEHMRIKPIPARRGRSRVSRGATAVALLATSVAGAFGLGASPAGAATFTVTNTANAGAGSLRAAIDSANATPGVDTINFAITAGASPVKTIDLLTPLMVTEPLVINGRSQASVADNTGVAFPATTVGVDRVGLPAISNMEIQIRLDSYVTNPGGVAGSQADNPFAGVADYPCATSPAYGGYFTGAFCASAAFELSGIAFQGFPDNEFQTNDDPVNAIDDSQEASNTYVGLTNGASGSYIHDNFFGLTASGGIVNRNAPFAVQTDPSTPLQSAQTSNVRVQGNVGSSSGATVSTHYDRDWVTSGNRFNGLVNAYRDLGSTDMTVSENSIRPLPSFVNGFTTGGDAFLFQPFGRTAASPGYNAAPTVENNTIVNAGRFTAFGTPGENGAVYTQVSGLRASKNVITDSGGPAFKVSGRGSGLPFAGNNVISQNQLSGNGTTGSENEGTGINLFPASGAGANGDNPWRTPNSATPRTGGNDLTKYPEFTASEVCGTTNVKVSGTAPAGSTVQLFTVGRGGHQGETYLASATAAANGSFSATVNTTAGKLTSTATTPYVAGTTRGTSEFTPDVTIEETCADLAIVKDTDPGDFRFQPGGDIPWKLTVSNKGPAKATNFSVEDYAPNGATISAVTSPQGTVTIAQDKKSFKIVGLNLDTGKSFKVDVTGKAPAKDFPDKLINASKVVPGDQVDPDLSNNQDDTGNPTDPDYVCPPGEPTCDIVPVAQADVKVTKTATDDVAVQPGGVLNWNVKVENLGPDTAKNVVLDDIAGNGTVSVESATPDKAGKTCTIDGINFTCELGDLASGASVNVVIAGTAAAEFGDIPAIWNYAKAGSTTPDPDLTNNEDDKGRDPENPGAPSDPECVEDPDAEPCYPGDDVVPTAKADVKVTKTATTEGPVQPGQDIEWNVKVENLGPDKAAGVKLADTFGNGTDKIVSVKSDKDGSECKIDGTKFTCELGDMASGDVVNVTVVSTASDDLAATNAVWNYARADSTTPDPDPTNNEDDKGRDPENPGAPSDPECVEDPDAEPCYPGDDVVPTAKADVKVTKTATTEGPVQPGQDIEWNVKVENLGPDKAAGVKLADTFGNGTDKIVSVKSDKDGSECKIDGTKFTCELGDMASGDVVNVTVVSTASDDLAATNAVWNYARADSTTPDPDPTNNEDDAGRDPKNPGAPSDPKCVGTPDECYPGDTAVPVASADVAVKKDLQGSQAVKTGQNVKFDLVLENLGPDTALDVVAADVQQPGLDFVSMKIVDAGDTVGLKVDGQTVTADSIPAGAKATLVAEFKVTATEGTIKNVWFATSKTPDPDITNNTDKDSGNPNDPKNPTEKDSDCTDTFEGCSSIKVENPAPPAPSAPDVPAPPAPPSAPDAPTPPPTIPLARTGTQVGLLGLVGLAGIAGGVVLIARRRKTTGDIA